MAPVDATTIRQVLEQAMVEIKEGLAFHEAAAQEALDELEQRLCELDRLAERLARGEPDESTLGRDPERVLKAIRERTESSLIGTRGAVTSIGIPQLLDRLRVLCIDLRLEGVACPPRRPPTALRFARLLERAAAALRTRAGVR